VLFVTTGGWCFLLPAILAFVMLTFLRAPRQPEQKDRAKRPLR